MSEVSSPNVSLHDMSTETEPFQNREVGNHQKPRKRLKPYKPPQLSLIGELLSTTLGGSPGAGDSGAGSEITCLPGDLSCPP
jgi:hypothetical protein